MKLSDKFLTLIPIPTILILGMFAYGLVSKIGIYCLLPLLLLNGIACITAIRRRKTWEAIANAFPFLVVAGFIGFLIVYGIPC